MKKLFVPVSILLFVLSSFAQRELGVRPTDTGIYVTMNPMGDIVMSRVTYEMMGGPKILFDTTNKRIGLKPAALAARNAYPVRVSNRSGAKMVRGHCLTREHRIILPHTVQFYDADIDEDGIFILDLPPTRSHPAPPTTRETAQNAGKWRRWLEKV